MSMAEKEKAAAEQVNNIGLPEPGTEPAFLPHPVMDALLEAVIALGGELWIERDRRRMLEALLDAKGLVTSEEVEGLELTQAQQAERDEALADLTRRVLEPLKQIKQ